MVVRDRGLEHILCWNAILTTLKEDSSVPTLRFLLNIPSYHPR